MKGLFEEVLTKKGDVLLIVPPFAGIESPSFAAHILKACAESKGFSVDIAYVNLEFASIMGIKDYKSFCYSSISMLGDMYFAHEAYGTSPFSKVGTDVGSFLNKYMNNSIVDTSNIEKILLNLGTWVDEVTEEFANMDYKVIGCSTCFTQTSASVALLNKIKEKKPEIITVIGGANCEGEMAEGILNLSNNIDYVFSGEGECSFSEFLEGVFSNNPPENKIIKEKQCLNLDEIPVPDYTQYINQIKLFLPDCEALKSNNILLSYESSRGCWWGQGEKHQCNFCGLNGRRTSFRQKSPDKVIHDLKIIHEQFPSAKILMVDNIMPQNYMETLLPRISKEIPDISFHYEVKANTTFDQLITLKNAGAFHLQPGIEALSTSLLKRMSKGVTASRNIYFLRNARSLDLDITWNLLYGFPGDIIEEYQETIQLIPQIIHLKPPESFGIMCLQRFSKYYNNPDTFGIKNIRPIDAYQLFLPENADIDKVAYYFSGDFECFSKKDQLLISEITKLVEKWIKLWRGNYIPKLHINRTSKDSYLLLDSRGLPGNKKMQVLTHKQAETVLIDRTVKSEEEITEEIIWAKNNKLIVEVDSRYVSLVTASPDLLQEMKKEN